MKHLTCLAAVLMVATSTGMARAEQQETRNCEFTVKKPRVSGQASITLVDGKTTKITVDVLYSDGRGTPGYICTIDSSRADQQESKWSEDGGATVIDNATPFNTSAPDRIKVTVGKLVSIDLEEAQSLGRCGVGAELPKAIVIPAKGKACRVWLREP
ncbi:hypothetical protein [Rhodoplanes sp. Z2-YC6860]|uniref:hypothetical protein n=1 Tax=Rhodoplanes sp. Z2-YC6860 TaxID=674703 RepID=UPI00078B4D3E|nr:hypothetical protein [Rhodoplanes sp. Z2-YC6860]AMN42987.1 hypothetical protein RHPLAN_45580 [Rhodoplanes sp. Z2-YC6860]